MEEKSKIKDLNVKACSNYIFFIKKSKSYFNNIFSLSLVNKKDLNNIEVKYKCPHLGCENTYALRNKLLAHLRTHCGIKPFICHICSKQFNDKGNLKIHLRIHTGERPYKCNICSKGFKAEGQLKEHLGSHFKDKPFQCPYCLKYYKRKGVVKNHILIHYQDPLFIEKKNMYEKIVDNLDNKNLMNSILYGNKSSSICSTKDESQNNSPITPTLKSKEKSIKDSSFSLDNINKANTKDIALNKIHINCLQQFGVEKDQKKLYINKNNNVYSDRIFYDKILINYNEENFNKIDFLEKNCEFYKKDENQDQYEFMDENSIYFPKIKEENKNNILLLEDIL